LDRPPEEIESIALTYNKLLAHILRDRQALEQSVAEKDVLLREVHHRVKNNLQLMASILNMQIRTVDDPTARAVLRRVQERVMSLSSIHKALYTDTTLATVRADRLLSEVVQAVTSVAQQARAGIDVSVKLDRAELDPDQAVPLALLTNELLTNALKYLGHPEDGPPHVAVRLAVDGQDMTLSVENSTGPAVIDQSGPEGTGLGRRLMDAFTMQLNGSLEIETQTDRHIVRMAFRAMDVADTAPPTHPHRDSPALAGAT
ncbi:MAG: sensor histidine kinase, partial [Pseudomonadota bacterium]